MTKSQNQVPIVVKRPRRHLESRIRIVKRKNRYNQPATTAGMLGGEGHIIPDFNKTKDILNIAYESISGFDKALDLAAGIGRIT